MKTARILYWTRSESDARDVASGVGVLENVPVKHVARIARDIDAFGESAIAEAIAKHGAIKPDRIKDKAARGHGVSVEYESGASRLYHAHD